MNLKPKCIIVTGRPGAGKSTLAAKLCRQLWMPVISRDEIKEGYVNTFGVKHDQLPPETNGVVTDFFFRIVEQYLENQVSIVVEAAFQHPLWASRLAPIEGLSRPAFIICELPGAVAASRHLQRGLNDAYREWYHGDKRVEIYRSTGVIAPASEYQTPEFDWPTMRVDTSDGYAPTMEEIVSFIREES